MIKHRPTGERGHTQDFHTQIHSLSNHPGFSVSRGQRGGRPHPTAGFLPSQLPGGLILETLSTSRHLGRLDVAGGVKEKSTYCQQGEGLGVRGGGL